MLGAALMAEAPLKVRKRRAWPRYLLLALFPLLIAGFVLAKKLRPVPVTVTPVVRGKAIEAVYATGTVEAEERLRVKAKTSGSLSELLVKEGTVVKKGDLLARIDNPAVTFDLERGRVDLNAASAQAGPAAPQLEALKSRAESLKAELDVARQDLARAERLLSGGSIAQAEVDRGRARVTGLEGTLRALEAEKRGAGIDLRANAGRQAAQVKSLAARVADTEVRAPIDGVVLVKHVELGEVVSVNQVLLTIGDTRRLVLEVSVDEADVARVSDGRDGRSASRAAVSLYAFADKVFEGRLFELMPDANRERKAFLAKVELLETPPGLRSGMTAEVNFIAREADGALLAPTAAVTDGHVWVISGDRASKRSIKTGIRDLLRVQVLSGLNQGDRVVVEGQDGLTEDKRVTVKERPADKREPQPDTSQPSTTSL
jgi:HlyD family secretion protein